MEQLDFELVKKRPVFHEIQSLFVFGEKLGIDLTAGMRDLKKALRVAEQVESSKLVDEYLIKAKKAFEKSITDFLLTKFYDLDKEMKSNNLSSKDIDYCMNSAFSAIGIRHYELALTNLEQCRKQVEDLKKPKFEKAQATEPIKCFICMGKVKPGFPMVKCNCGKTYHEPCAMRAGKCECGVLFK
jgi:hypothetical protein